MTIFSFQNQRQSSTAHKSGKSLGLNTPYVLVCILARNILGVTFTIFNEIPVYIPPSDYWILIFYIRDCPLLPVF